MSELSEVAEVVKHARAELLARIAQLETHLRRVLEAGKRARQIAVVSYPDIAAAWDEAASDAEGVLRG